MSSAAHLPKQDILSAGEKVAEYTSIAQEYLKRALSAEEQGDLPTALMTYTRGVDAATLGLECAARTSKGSAFHTDALKKYKWMMEDRVHALEANPAAHAASSASTGSSGRSKPPAPALAPSASRAGSSTTPSTPPTESVWKRLFSFGSNDDAAKKEAARSSARESDNADLPRALTAPPPHHTPASACAQRTRRGSDGTTSNKAEAAAALRRGYAGHNTNATGPTTSGKPSSVCKAVQGRSAVNAAAAGVAAAGPSCSKMSTPTRNFDGLAKQLVRKYEKRFVEDILGDIVRPEDIATRWGSVTGLESCKQHLAEAVVYPILRADLFGGLRAPPRGVLLFGPPGNGKTLIAKAVAGESKAVFFSISASSLVSKFLGDGEKMVRALFGCAEALAPSVVFIDEVDSLLSARGEEHDAMRRLKTEVLVQMDGVTTNADKQVLVLAATNRPGDIDTACLRRFAKRILIPLPDAKQRNSHLRKLLRGHDIPVAMSERDMDDVAHRTDRYSFSDLTGLTREAAMQPLRELGSHVVDVQKKDIRPVRLDDFTKALRVVRPSATEDECRALEEWAKKYGTSG